jgi:hypothetical protein
VNITLTVVCLSRRLISESLHSSLFCMFRQCVRIYASLFCISACCIVSINRELKTKTIRPRAALNFTAMRYFMKLFRSSNSVLINECMFLFGVDSVSVNLQKRIGKFVARYVSIENKICQLVSKYIIQ